MGFRAILSTILVAPFMIPLAAIALGAIYLLNHLNQFASAIDGEPFEEIAVVYVSDFEDLHD